MHKTTFGSNKLAMRITDSNTVRSLQIAFTSVYPNLKLEFFKVSKQGGKITTTVKLDPSTRLGDVRKVHNNGFIKLDDKITVNGLVTTLHEVFGLYAVVYRNSFDTWRPLRPSDKGTLREHDLRGFLSNQRLQIG